MFIEPAIVVQTDNSFVKDIQEDLYRLTKGRFEPQGIAREDYEAIFRLLLEEVQKRSIEDR